MDSMHRALDTQFQRLSQETFLSEGPTVEQKPPQHPSEARSQKEALLAAGRGQRPRGGDGPRQRSRPNTNPANDPSGINGDKPRDSSNDRGSRPGKDERCMPQDGETARAPLQSATPAVASSAMQCEFAGCQRTPRYGLKDGPVRFCQGHKVAGMFTRRDGVLLMATRDGTAFREAAPAPAPTFHAGKTAAATGSGRTTREAVLPVANAHVRPSLHGVKPSTFPKTTSTVLRKKCEAPGCNVQPSYGDVGSSRPRFCSGHKQDRMVSLKNRPCLFPGCMVRPHYGLSMGRAVFCVTHKKEGMVHLLRESKTLEKDALKRKRHESRHDGQEGSSAETSVHCTQDNGGWVQSHSGQQRKEKGAAGGGKRSAEEIGGKQARTIPEGPGLAPSDEMRLVREVRELAQAAAAASGSGRRARVPSRKLLEASGVLAAGESAQWMTKEKKEEENRITRELKEQRKAAAAAGLKVGEVIETIVPSFRGMGKRSQGSLGSASMRSGGPAVSKASWRKLTPAELRAAGKQQPTAGGAAPDILRNNNTPAFATKVATGSKEQKRRASAAPAAADDRNISEKARKGVAAAPAAERCVAQNRPLTVEAARASSPKCGRDDHAEGSTYDASKRVRSEEQGERKANAAAKVTCELESCSRTAKFGVNGVVRYCKMHRIFGMHKIVGVK